MAKARDDGIIWPLGITEQERDKLRKRDWSKRQRKPEEFSDNWTTAECEKNKFSGIRINKLNGTVEMWLIGQCKGTRRITEVSNNPSILADLHEEVFGTVGSLIELDLVHKRLKI